ncbi:hypothetical protein IF1G_05239 [Cordyceps javanica]|uniref:Uncharacterized protein n=1 Tax=Cordyceps javanica TaxID=43265 RepID=A0A545V4N6_9HYPO|nr:hypothetical protein IF1G_05239 [Cordyceps javanica]
MVSALPLYSISFRPTLDMMGWLQKQERYALFRPSLPSLPSPRQGSLSYQYFGQVGFASLVRPAQRQQRKSSQQGYTAPHARFRL